MSAQDLFRSTSTFVMGTGLILPTVSGALFSIITLFPAALLCLTVSQKLGQVRLSGRTKSLTCVLKQSCELMFASCTSFGEYVCWSVCAQSGTLSTTSSVIRSVGRPKNQSSSLYVTVFLCLFTVQQFANSASLGPTEGASSLAVQNFFSPKLLLQVPDRARAKRDAGGPAERSGPKRNHQML